VDLGLVESLMVWPPLQLSLLLFSPEIVELFLISYTLCMYYVKGTVHFSK